MKYTKDNPKIVYEAKEIDDLEMRDYFKFKCAKCGKSQIKQVNTKSKMPTHKKMLCTSCLTRVNHYTKNNPKHITSFEELKQLHKYDSFTFRCKKCNNLYLVSSFRKERMNNYKNFLCLSCFRSEFRKTHPEISVKSQETIHKNHGEHNTQTFENRELMRLRNLNHPELIDTLQKFRKKYPEKCQPKRITYNNLSFDSIPEFCVYLFCINHCIKLF